MVDSSREDEHVPRLRKDADPLVVLVADVEVALAVEDVADLLVLVDVLAEEHVYLLVVRGSHDAGRDGDLVAVGIVARSGDGLELGERGRSFDGERVIQDPKPGESLLRQLVARVVWQPAVGLEIHVSIFWEDAV